MMLDASEASCSGSRLSLTSPSLTSPPCLSASSRSNELEKIPDDIITDPALGRQPVECPSCAHVGAVYIMPKISAADDRIKLVFVCTNAACRHKWQN
jgi:DNA-directed RNA polymerase subunit M/transcription elongation factor TFIIS